ncbi:hypothetical protein O3M35_009393 [Rhynocoris fuscipes]|uniref:acid phosphatase n=1 Tax=Rhynocoris fuscipes TaxID=488301 RepID=A0AAW1DAB8_9HEMI
MSMNIVALYPLLLLIQNIYGNHLSRHLDHEIGQVVFINILYRHGERTPIECYPNDPYKNLTYWPCDWGQLTNVGKLHHYVLGNWLRSRYNHLVPNGRYNNRAIYVRSTDVDRTLMSAEANLAGMFPPDEVEVWSAIKWQPIPVHTVPEEEDKLLAMKAPCKRYDVAYKHFISSLEMKKINEKYKDLYDYLSSHCGKVVDDLDGIDYLYSTLFIEKLANLTLPEWTKEVFPVKMKEPAGLSFAIPTYTTELKRLRGGPLVKEMLDNMQKKIDGNLERNISVYSGHDTTIGNLLNTMGIFNEISPPFAATVLVELRKNSMDGQHYVTILYKNSSSSPHLLTLPGCTEACPLDKVKTLLHDVIPINWDTECHSHELFDLSNGQPYHSLAIFDEVKNSIHNEPVVYTVD